MKRQWIPPSKVKEQQMYGGSWAWVALQGASLREGLRHWVKAAVGPLVLPVVLLLTSTALAQEVVQASAYAQLPPGKQIVKVRFAGDYLEIDQLAQALRAEILRQEHPFLFLQIDNAQLPELQRRGYQPELVDPQDFFTQVVRTEPPNDEHIERVRGIGGELIQREAEFAVFRLTLRQLDTLRRENIPFRPIQEGDLVPRFVSITAPDVAAVRLIVSVGVDIFEGREGVILGRAFDGQIGTLRRHGLKVEPASRPFGPQP
jgi:hypothetical protein